MEKNSLHDSRRPIFSAAAALLIAFVINPALFLGGIRRAAAVLSPVIIGMTAAFVLNRPACAIYDLILIGIKKQRRLHFKRLPFFSTAHCEIGVAGGVNPKIWLAAVISVYIILIAAAAGIVSIIVPQLAQSVRTLIDSADLYRDKLAAYYSTLLGKDKFGILPSLSSSFNSIEGKLPDIAAAAYGRTADLIGGITDFAIGLVISVYILLTKEGLRRFFRKAAHKLLSERAYGKTVSCYSLIYDTFSRFVTGQLCEAVILGALCFAGMTLFGFEYAPLISTVIGISALVPVAGAIIGTIPSAFLLFLSEPMQAVWFILFIIVLQQLENNLIYPRIVGKSMGLPPLPVLLAIIIGAKLGGAAGILLAVPLTAVIYGVVKKAMEDKA